MIWNSSFIFSPKFTLKLTIKKKKWLAFATLTIFYFLPCVWEKQGHIKITKLSAWWRPAFFHMVDICWVSWLWWHHLCYVFPKFYRDLITFRFINLLIYVCNCWFWTDFIYLRFLFLLVIFFFSIPFKPGLFPPDFKCVRCPVSFEKDY